MVRMATLTMLMSSTDMNIPAISTASGRPQPPPDGATGAAPVPGPVETSDTMSRVLHNDRRARIVGRCPAVTGRGPQVRADLAIGSAAVRPSDPDGCPTG